MRETIKILLITGVILLNFSLSNAQVATTTSGTSTQTTITTSSSTTSTSTVNTEKNAVIMLSNYFVDPEKNPFPNEFKPVLKEAQKYVASQKKYTEAIKKAFSTPYDLESRNIIKKEGAKKIVVELDQQIKGLQKIRNQKNIDSANFEKALKTKIKNKKLTQEYTNYRVGNEQDIENTLNKIYNNSIEYLYNALSFYTLLSKNPTDFQFYNGILFAEHYDVTFGYFDYLKKSRAIYKVINGNYENLFKQMQQDPEFLKTLLSEEDIKMLKQGQEYAAEYNKITDGNVSQAQDFNNNTVVLEYNRRVNEDSQILEYQRQIAEIDNKLKDLLPHDENAQVFKSKTDLKKMSDLVDQMSKLNQQARIREYNIRVAYSKELGKTSKVHQSFLYLNEAEVSDYDLNLQKDLYAIESVDLINKTFKLLYKNFGKFRVTITDPNENYNYVIQNFSDNYAYRQMSDKFTARYSKYLETLKQGQQ